MQTVEVQVFHASELTGAAKERARVRISQLLYAHPALVEAAMRTEYQRMT